MEEWARIASRLRQQGLYVSEDFVRAAAAGETSGDSERTVFGKCLDCDFHVCGLGCLPSDIESWDKQVLAGTVVLQVDELVDMAASAKQRYDGSKGSARCLKLYMTDGLLLRAMTMPAHVRVMKGPFAGKLHVCGYEQEHIPDLSPLMQAGVKVLQVQVALQDVLLRRGLMALTPRSVKVLGGKVDRLEEARQRAVAQWRQPVACNSGGARDGVRQTLYDEARAAAWPQTGTSRVGSGQGGSHAAPAPSTIRAEAGPAPGEAPPGTHPSQQQSARLPGTAALALIQRVQAEIETEATPSSVDGLDILRHKESHIHQRQEQDRLRNGHTQPALDVSNLDQAQNGAHAMDYAADRDSWSSGDPYCDALKEQLPPADEVVELSGDDDSSAVFSGSHAGMQHMGTVARGAEPHDQDDMVSSKGRGDDKAASRPLPQLAREDVANPAKELSIFAAVTEMVSKLQFLDEHQQALQHYSMEVRIEERASGDEYIASVHPRVLEGVLGMTPVEMRDCLAQGKHERVRERISYLKQFVSTFAGQMLLRTGAAPSQPVICHFAGADDGDLIQDLPQLTNDPSLLN